MASDLEQFLKDVFGEPASRVMAFQSEQWQRVQTKLSDLAREAVKDELAKLHNDIADLRARIATLESERARVAAESIDSSF